MNSDRPIVQRLRDANEVASQVAEDTLTLIRDLLKVKNAVHLCVTGGTVGIATLAAMAAKSKLIDIDYKKLHVWWGDERFVPKSHPDRNAFQARSAWLNFIDIPAENIHEFPSSDEGFDLETAAESFNTHYGHVNPSFDLVLLGMGPDGHINSLFPGKPIPLPGVAVIAEHDSPKPPPQRLSFTYEVVNGADRIWITVAGADKQDAVEVAFGENPEKLPIGRIRGKIETKWYLDSTAATKVFGC